jgi:predicted PurR-regulated permease PerM
MQTKDQNTMGRVKLLLLLAIGISLLFFMVVKGFAVALLMAAVLAGLTLPVFNRLTKWLRGRKSPAAILTVLLTIIVVIVPVILFLGILVHEAAQVSTSLESWLNEYVEYINDSDKVQKAIEEDETLRKLLPYQEQIVEKTGQLASQAASFVGQQVVSASQGTAEFFLMLFVTLYAMFYFLKDGRSILDWIFAYTPLSKGDQERLIGTFSSVSQATLKSTVVIGIVQGGLAGIAFAVAGIGGAVFWAAIMAVLSILPGIGAALVWVPTVVYLVMLGRYEAAVGLALWCAVVVGTADNILRPLLIGKDTEMPDLMVFLTTLGGIVLFGATGIVIGPVIGALFLAAWDLWGMAMEKSDTVPSPIKESKS